ncbi:MAG: hypothetical protein WDN04_01035 [Rhodospirillales bacterium]
MAALSDPLFLAGITIATGSFSARLWRGHGSLVHFLIRLVVFCVLTGLLLRGGVAPYRPGTAAGSGTRNLFAGALEVVWWIVGAWLAVGFLRAFIVLGRRPHEAQLVQDLLAALVYIAATFAVVAMCSTCR